MTRSDIIQGLAAVASIGFVLWIGQSMSDLRRDTEARTAAVEEQIAQMPRVEVWATSIPEWVFTAVQTPDGQTLDFHLVGADVAMPRTALLPMPPAKP